MAGLVCVPVISAHYRATLAQIKVRALCCAPACVCVCVCGRQSELKVEHALFTGDKATLTAQLANLFALSMVLDHNVPPLICAYVLRDKQ